MLVHGSPCQDFSRAGKRLGGNDEDKTRSSLMWETIRIIENMGKWKPKVVVWENVKGVLAKDMIHSFKKYFVEMERLGYTNSYQVLDARDFGIPQKRERVFVISMLDGYWFNFDTLERKPMCNISEFVLKQVDDKYTITSPSMLRAINKRNGFGGGLKPIEEFSWTITTKQNRVPNSGIVPIGNGKYRLLTELECWRLMGFDDEDYYKVANEHPTRKNMTNGTLYKQAGNSIVVQVLEAIFKQIIDMRVINDESLRIY
ncbi:DNA (cytosine-5-)-methyltransferase [Staphylococcus pseudintermedius]|nr:DNA (cytosine-5-)-methyltransferase [Staphylococcus pseudintermedius]